VGGVIDTPNGAMGLTCHHCVTGYGLHPEVFSAKLSTLERPDQSIWYLTEPNPFGGQEVTTADASLGTILSSVIGNVCPTTLTTDQMLVSTGEPNSLATDCKEVNVSNSFARGVDVAFISFRSTQKRNLAGEIGPTNPADIEYLFQYPSLGKPPTGRFQHEPFVLSGRTGQNVRLTGARHRILVGTMFPCHTKVYRKRSGFRTEKYAAYVFENMCLTAAQNLVKDDVSCVLFNQYVIRLDSKLCIPISPQMNIMDGNSGSLAFDANGDCVGMLHSASLSFGHLIVCPLEPAFQLNGWSPKEITLLL
jgi:hypothetical protein